ncbi:hypothetical protein C8R47DRAFT_804089 [Mycena vitilis]|nr:hypothetical protein C8R47DRAFT_804089 [Mycena vitilis]
MLTALEADRARVVELQIQILHLEHTLSELCLEKSQAQQRIDSYNYISTLPIELECEIFMHVLPPHPHFPWLAGPSSPTVLAQVCRRWRYIALATSALWSGIKISEIDDPEAHMFEIWLGRSRHCPLSLNFWHSFSEGDNKHVGAAVPHRARLEYLKIDLDTGASDHRVLDGPMPLLRHRSTMRYSTVTTLPFVMSPCCAVSF